MLHIVHRHCDAGVGHRPPATRCIVRSIGLKFEPDLLMPRDPGVVRDAAIAEVLRGLVKSDFERARYYELDFQVPRAGERGFSNLAVLADVYPSDPHEDFTVGYAIRWESTASYVASEGLAVVAASASEFRSRYPQCSGWIEQLALDGRSFVDVPVIRNGRPVGLIAADWPDASGELTHECQRRLSELGLLLGSLRESERLDIPSLQAASADPDNLATTACVEMMQAIDAAFGAVFRYDWRRECLAKVTEFFSGPSSLDPLEVSISEPEYSIGDGFLTGRAWSSSDYRYVADLEDLAEELPGWVEPGSKRAHSDMHGFPAKSVLYLVAGHEEPTYLFRFFNRADKPELPFMRRRRQICSRMAEQLARRIDYAIADGRAHALARITQTAVAKVHSPQAVVASTMPALEREGVPDFAFVSIARGSDTPTFTHVSPALRSPHPIANLASNPRPLAFTEDVPADDTSSVRLINSSGSTELVAENAIALVVQSRSTESIGSLIIPVDLTASSNPQTYAAHLRPYCDLLTSSVDALAMFISEEGARRALGYIGHEIGTPFAVLGDAAIAVAVEGMRVADQLAKSDPDLQRQLRHTSRQSYIRIQRSRDEIDRVMEIAPVLASMGSGSIKMFFTEVDVADVFKTARSRIVTETQGTQPVASGVKVPARSRKFEVEISDSLDRLPLISGDVGLLTQVALNLLRNAVKYSLPRHPPRPMVIQVSGHRIDDASIGVIIQNWGWGISPELQTRVFLPFVRGQIDDRLKSLPGMGLGLYLVRTIMTAHGGTAICRSKPTLDDPNREPLFGWETSFEVRLPTATRLGPQSAVIDPYRK